MRRYSCRDNWSVDGRTHDMAWRWNYMSWSEVTGHRSLSHSIRLNMLWMRSSKGSEVRNYRRSID